MRYALYFNGLGSGKTRKRERFAMRYLAKHDVEVEHVPIDWRSGESFGALLDRLVEVTKQKLQEHGELLLVGSSAGGSLAINIVGRLHNKNLSAVTLCSRLHLAELPRWDRRSLKRMAHIGTPKQSQSFYDSVDYCTKTTIPKLTAKDKKRIAIVQQLADDVVPRSTMSIDGVKTYKVAAVGHGWGIAAGVRQLPKLDKILSEVVFEDKYPYLAKWPRGDTAFAIPIAGLMTSVLDRHKAITHHNSQFKLTKVPIEQKHKDATNRIATVTGYLITIHYRLFNDDAPKLFLDKNLDWESLRINAQILLDSFAVLVPILYGVTPKYDGVCPICQKTPKKCSVDSFNQIEQWIDKHGLDDEFTRHYKQLKSKSGWYKLVNMDRTDFIHKRATPNVVHKQKVGKHTVSKDLLIRISKDPIAPADITTIEKEAETVLRNLFEFLAFSSNFFVGKLTAQGCVVSESEQYKYNLWFNLKQFNKTLFNK